MRLLALFLVGISAAFATEDADGSTRTRVAPPSSCDLIEPPQLKHGCYWLPRRNPVSGCLTNYDQRCLPVLPVNCKTVTEPVVREDCSLVSIHDEVGCITKFECEPLSGCPDVDEPGPNSGCSWVPVRDQIGCTVEYECVSTRKPASATNSRLAVQFQSSQGSDIVASGPIFQLPDEIPSALPSLPNRCPGATGCPSGIPIPPPPPVAPLRFEPPPPPLPPIPALPRFRHLAPPIFRPPPVFRPPPPPPVRYSLPCPPPPREPTQSESCSWKAINDANGCTIDYECESKEPPAPPCPQAPEKPRFGERCNWIAILDKHNCIVDYECEPKPAEPCPPPPVRPDDDQYCKFIPIKSAQGCVQKYDCEPVAPPPLPFPIPRRIPLHLLLPLARPALPLLPPFPLPAPLPLPAPFPFPAPLPLPAPFPFPAPLPLPAAAPFAPFAAPPVPLPAAITPNFPFLSAPAAFPGAFLPPPQPGFTNNNDFAQAAQAAIAAAQSLNPAPASNANTNQQQQSPRFKLTKATSFRTVASVPNGQVTSLDFDTFGRDNEALCCWWASNGECDRNPYFMRTKCQKSCGTYGCTAANALSCQVAVNTQGCPYATKTILAVRAK